MVAPLTIEGGITIGGGISYELESAITINTNSEAEIILFDLV